MKKILFLFLAPCTLLVGAEWAFARREIRGSSGRNYDADAEKILNLGTHHKTRKFYLLPGDMHRVDEPTR